jgi:hypothetical protein
LACQAIEVGIRHWCVSRRRRIPGFVHRHFSLSGTIALHRHAIGWDILRAPLNLMLALPALVLHCAAKTARRFGRVGVADALSRIRLLWPTAVARHVEWLVRAELLELSPRHDALDEAIGHEALREVLRRMGAECDEPLLQRLGQTVADYAGARPAAAEITTGLVSLGTGALTLES